MKGAWTSFLSQDVAGDSVALSDTLQVGCSGFGNPTMRLFIISFRGNSYEFTEKHADVPCVFQGKDPCFL